MSRLLYQSFLQHISLSEEDFQHILRHFHPRTIKKKTLFLREGMTTTTIAFILKGTVRAYYLSDAGIEQVNQLALEQHWIGDLYAFLKSEPARQYIEALEDTEILAVNGHDLEQLYPEYPQLERYFRILFQNAYIHTQQRLNASLHVPAIERYRQLIERNPAIGLRVPLIHIASYLGITPESLSRIRKQLAQV
jgi:CRP-like cAMP-binding protein